VATLVDGVQGHANRNKGTVKMDEGTVKMIHFPMTMGNQNCYKCYMASLDYHVSSTAQGGLIVTGVGEKAVDSGEFVSLTTYYYKWKQQYPHLKVNRPAEDICQYCYAFCNCHRYLANHSLFGGNCNEADGVETNEYLLHNAGLDVANAVDDGGAGNVAGAVNDGVDEGCANVAMMAGENQPGED
jgi:hypothetical protein